MATQFCCSTTLEMDDLCLEELMIRALLVSNIRVCGDCFSLIFPR